MQLRQMANHPMILRSPRAAGARKGRRREEGECRTTCHPGQPNSRGGMLLDESTGLSWSAAGGCQRCRWSLDVPGVTRGSSAAGALRWNANAWRIEHVANPRADVTSVSCTSSKACTAVGYTSSRAIWAESCNGVRWTSDDPSCARGRGEFTQGVVLCVRPERRHWRERRQQERRRHRGTHRALLVPRARASIGRHAIRPDSLSVNSDRGIPALVGCEACGPAAEMEL